jgi:hypothetical protein
MLQIAGGILLAVAVLTAIMMFFSATLQGGESGPRPTRTVEQTTSTS